LADAIESTLEQLSEDAFIPSLRTHKLRGPLSGRWACSAGYDLRIVFKVVPHDGNEAILLLALGKHDEVY
jgi:mRNA-degrading endonuclease YafQ of YafQ-DinJ toxin-antitoxin module